TDMCGTSLERLHHRHAAKGVLPHVKDDRIPVRGHNRRPESLEALATKIGTSRSRRGVDCLQDALLADDALGLYPREQRPLRAKVVVLQHQRGNTWVVEVAVVALAIRVDELVLRDPVQLVRKRG